MPRTRTPVSLWVVICTDRTLIQNSSLVLFPGAKPVVKRPKVASIPSAVIKSLSNFLFNFLRSIMKVVFFARKSPQRQLAATASKSSKKFPEGILKQTNYIYSVPRDVAKLDVSAVDIQMKMKGHNTNHLKNINLNDNDELTLDDDFDVKSVRSHMTTKTSMTNVTHSYLTSRSRANMQHQASDPAHLNNRDSRASSISKPRSRTDAPSHLHSYSRQDGSGRFQELEKEKLSRLLWALRP